MARFLPFPLATKAYSFRQYFSAKGCFCATPWRHNFLFGLARSKGLCLSSIVSLDKQASVNHEVCIRIMTTKPFSQTIRMCYAPGVKGEPPMPFIETQCTGKSTNSLYVKLDMDKEVRVLLISRRYNIILMNSKCMVDNSLKVFVGLQKLRDSQRGSGIIPPRSSNQEFFYQHMNLFTLYLILHTFLLQSNSLGLPCP
ncbi:hypothetical protein TNCV_2313491 [Trichonephila clavipes]|nr:hypothetical protein TNCV_2313491 [Trichonephila clavipes]